MRKESRTLCLFQFALCLPRPLTVLFSFFFSFLAPSAHRHEKKKNQPLVSFFFFSKRSFGEAHAALSEGFGGPHAIPADVLLLWSALGLDAGEPLAVAAALSSFLDAATVPGVGGGVSSSSPSSSLSSTSTSASTPSPFTKGPVLGPDQYEAAARMLLCEALIKEARSPAAARAWISAGGAERGLPRERASALAAEVEAAASAAEASESMASEVVAASSVAAPPPMPPPMTTTEARGGRSGGDIAGREEAKAKAAPAEATLSSSSPSSSSSSSSSKAAALQSSGSTVALGTAPGGPGVVLRSTSFLASTPDRLAELWGGGSNSGSGNGEAEQQRQRRSNNAPRRASSSSSSPHPLLASLFSPDSPLLSAQAAAAAVGAVVAYAAFAERKSIARAGRSGLRALASTLGLALKVTPS